MFVNCLVDAWCQRQLNKPYDDKGHWARTGKLNDQLLKRGDSTIRATVSAISGPEANTYSGEFIHVENFQKVTRAVDQTEDIKVILDF